MNNVSSMKIISVILAALLPLVAAGEAIHEKYLSEPYPRQDDMICINPVPLKVPLGMMQTEFMQFQMSMDRHFGDSTVITSEPVAWNIFNAHKELAPGTWYWRFRGVSADGKTLPWSRTFSFSIAEDIPVFVTPGYDVFRKNIPAEGPRLYCFLEDSLPEARKAMRRHPEFESMIADSRTALASDFRNDTLPFRRITQIYDMNQNLYTAYRMLQRDLYADKMVQNICCLLRTEPDMVVISNDFKAGELMYTLALAYESCHDRFSDDELKQIEDLMLLTLRTHEPRIRENEVDMFFDNHFWQFTFRHMLQGALVLCDRYPEVEEYLEFSYELWTGKAPATGFNRDGNWHNGTCYFSANAVSLGYTALLFSHLTGTDFFQHPWYRNSGIGVAYSWLPWSMSAGFGDGHEQMNPKPLRIRSAYADMLARETGDPYAAWYSSLNDRYPDEPETRFYRMACGKSRPANADLPADAPEAVWFEDSGEFLANSDLRDPDSNLSLSFRSSPFGSGSHTHSNQNAFNLHFRGVPVYRSAGHYMNFQDPHNLLQYRHTRGHNTVLVNGIGQPFTSGAYGQILETVADDGFAYALGDASNAYCGISDDPMWIEKMADSGVEQSEENGFGKTPLRKFRRYIAMLGDDKVLVYDELEASEAAEWDWLLHSPVRFDVEENVLYTENPEHGFHARTALFSTDSLEISQTDRYWAPVNEKVAQRGEDFTPEWSLSAKTAPLKKVRILAFVQVRNGHVAFDDIVREDTCTFRFGNWTVEAQMNPDRKAGLRISDSVSGKEYILPSESL